MENLRYWCFYSFHHSKYRKQNFFVWKISFLLKPIVCCCMSLQNKNKIFPKKMYLVTFTMFQFFIPKKCSVSVWRWWKLVMIHCQHHLANFQKLFTDRQLYCSVTISPTILTLLYGTSNILFHIAFISFKIDFYSMHSETKINKRYLNRVIKNQKKKCFSWCAMWIKSVKQ